MAKDHPGVVRIHERVMAEYDRGRTTAISDREMVDLVRENLSAWLEESGFEI
jgi:hypothetical protein